MLETKVLHLGDWSPVNLKMIFPQQIMASRFVELWDTDAIVVAPGLKLLRSMWDLPRSEVEPISFALAG